VDDQRASSWEEEKSEKELILFLSSNTLSFLEKDRKPTGKMGRKKSLELTISSISTLPEGEDR